jgi:hypothetical protein
MTFASMPGTLKECESCGFRDCDNCMLLKPLDVKPPINESMAEEIEKLQSQIDELKNKHIKVLVAYSRSLAWEQAENKRLQERINRQRKEIRFLHSKIINQEVKE